MMTGRLSESEAMCREVIATADVDEASWPAHP